MGNFGIKISKIGEDVKTATPDKLVFSSKYKSLRVRIQGGGSITHSGGRTITIPHNLGYVPYYFVHATPDPIMTGFYASDNDYFIHPIIPIITGALHLDRQAYSYADDTNLYIKLGADFGYSYFHTGLSVNDYGHYYHDGGNYFNQYGVVGNGDPYGIEDGAIRFQGVTLAQGSSVISATVFIYCGSRNGSGVIKYKLYGMDEDDTNDFGSNPFGRDKTSAVQQSDAANPSQGGYETIGGNNIRDIVNEIIGRGGWSSGNHIGLMLFDNGTVSPDNFAWSSGWDNHPYGSNSYLRVLKSNALCDYKYTIFYNKIE